MLILEIRIILINDLNISLRQWGNLSKLNSKYVRGNKVRAEINVQYLQNHWRKSMKKKLIL